MADETSADLEMTNGGIDEAALKERLEIISQLIDESQAVDVWLLDIQSSLIAQLKEFEEQNDE